MLLLDAFKGKCLLCGLIGQDRSWPPQARPLSREKSTRCCPGDWDQWQASCRGFPACTWFQFSLSLSPRLGVLWRGTDFSGRVSLQSMLYPLALLTTTSPCFVEQKRESGYTSHWFFCFLFMIHVCEYFRKTLLVKILLGSVLCCPIFFMPG